MYRIYREYCNSEPFPRCCGMPGKWLKLGFVRPWYKTSRRFYKKILAAFFFFWLFVFVLLLFGPILKYRKNKSAKGSHELIILCKLEGTFSLDVVEYSCNRILPYLHVDTIYIRERRLLETGSSF